VNSHLKAQGERGFARRVDDETTLRIEQVKLAFQTVERAIDLRARRHLAILAVALAALASALVGGLARQVPMEIVVGLALALVGVAAQQLMALERLETELREAGKRAMGPSKG
jgi:hypothetical protein